MADRNENKTDQNPFNEIDKLIHEPTRLMIFSYLYIVESADFTFLIRQTGLTWGNLSAHITKLENVGYVEIVKEFKNKKPNTMLSLTNKGREAFNIYRKNMKQIFEDLPE